MVAMGSGHEMITGGGFTANKNQEQASNKEGANCKLGRRVWSALSGYGCWPCDHRVQPYYLLYGIDVDHSSCRSCLCLRP